MRRIFLVSGRLVEVHRHINVPMRWCEQYPARERRELWVSTPEGEEFKLIVHSREMPARQGHQVVALVLPSGQMVGLLNATTGERINYLRSDPPLLWRRCDSAALSALVLAGFTAIVLTDPAAMLTIWATGVFLVPTLLLVRLVRRWHAARRVERGLDGLRPSIESREPSLRRVK